MASAKPPRSMRPSQSTLALLDALLRASRVTVGKRLRARGIPAVLLGASAIVLASGVSTALQRAMTILPESLREARSFWLAIRDDRRERLP
jgi:hypothetical protein